MKQNIYKTVLLAVGLILFAVALYVYFPRQNKLTRITVVGDSQTEGCAGYCGDDFFGRHASKTGVGRATGKCEEERSSQSGG